MYVPTSQPNRINAQSVMDMVKSRSNINPLFVLNAKERQHINQKSISQRKLESIKSEHQLPQAVMSV